MSMILYESIRDFNSVIEKCPFCNKDLQTGFFPKQHIAADIAYTTKLNEISFQYWNYTYESFVENNELKLGLSSATHSSVSFSANIDTGIISGASPANIQHIINTHDLVFFRGCANKLCIDGGIAYISNTIIFGHKSSKIYPFYIDLSAITVVIENNKFSLISANKTNETYLCDSEGVLATLPIIELHKIADKESLIQKIKTFTLFL